MSYVFRNRFKEKEVGWLYELMYHLKSEIALSLPAHAGVKI
jgi:hypothetical protein